jgi:hypothetical protein
MTLQPRLLPSLLPAAALAASLCLLTLAGCAPERATGAPADGPDDTADASPDLPTPLDTGADARRERTLGDGAFEVRFGDQGGFDETSEAAAVEIAEPGIVAFEAQGWYARVSGEGLEEASPEATTDRLDRLDTTVSLEVAVDGEMVEVNCYTAETPRGGFTRTELTDGWVSGSFEVEIVRCDGFSGQEIEFPEEPFTVTGRFRRLPRT